MIAFCSEIWCRRFGLFQAGGFVVFRLPLPVKRCRIRSMIVCPATSRPSAARRGSVCAAAKRFALPGLALLVCYCVIFAQGCAKRSIIRTDIRTEYTPKKPDTVYIKGGTIIMGTDIKDTTDTEYHADESPISVTVSDFRMGKYPVTAKEYCMFLNSDNIYSAEFRKDVSGNVLIGIDKWSAITRLGNKFVPRNGADNSPATNITWYGAVFYCQWLSERLKRSYRLPTEAEWEYAARGKERRSWPWGEAAPQPKHGYRWTYKPYDEKEPWDKCPVGSYPAGATPEGVMDLLGYGDGEWCLNKYNEKPTPKNMSDESLYFDDVLSLRGVRGVYQRDTDLTNKPSFPYAYLFYGLHHDGRVWTREKKNPFNLDTTTTFRVVEEIDAAGGGGSGVK